MKDFFIRLRKLEKWQKKRLYGCFLLILVIGSSFLLYTTNDLRTDRNDEDVYWENAMAETDNVTAEQKELTKDAIPVTTGAYIENVKSMDLKSNSYRLEMVIWFRWNGNNDLDMANNFRIYKGSFNKKDIIKEVNEGDVNYQLVRADVTVSKNFWTKRFPLESHQLRMYIESQITADHVLLIPDVENTSFNRSLSISGYDMTKSSIGAFLNNYPTTQNDPTVEKAVTTSEIMFQMEINRNSMGLYLKCFIALLGTTLWVLITLFINTYHRIDPLGMVPAALFGTVTNIMVGANLLPDALDLGLLEYVNAWGILTILAVTFSIININRIRNKYEDREFAALFGKVMFFTVLILVLAGHIALPLSAYIM